MANTVLLPPDEGVTNEPVRLRPLDSASLSGDLSAVAEENVFHSIYTSIREAFFAPKLPPLVLESQPIPVVDRMAVKRDPTSTIISTVINGGVLALILWFAAHQVVKQMTKPAQAITLVEPIPPPKAPPKAVIMGGGGGQKGPSPVTKGNPPKFSPQQLNPPKIPVADAKLTPPVTVDVDPNIKMAKSDMPNFGMPNSPLIGTSLGNGNGSGIGSGNGNGIGPGSGGNMGGGIRRIGGGVSAPIVLFAPEPEFSEEARKAKVAGNVLVYLQVGTDGRPKNVRVLRGIGLGLDEKAVEAVRNYKFKPAMENGHPVTVEMNVEVNFQIF